MFLPKEKVGGVFFVLKKNNFAPKKKKKNNNECPVMVVDVADGRTILHFDRPLHVENAQDIGGPLDPPDQQETFFVYARGSRHDFSYHGVDSKRYGTLNFVSGGILTAENS